MALFIAFGVFLILSVISGYTSYVLGLGQWFTVICGAINTLIVVVVYNFFHKRGM